MHNCWEGFCFTKLDSANRSVGTPIQWNTDPTSVLVQTFILINMKLKLSLLSRALIHKAVLYVFLSFTTVLFLWIKPWLTILRYEFLTVFQIS